MLKVQPRGDGYNGILVVGEAPGAEEAATGKPFIGSSGRELVRMMGEAGINLDRCRITNVTGYRPLGNDISEFFPTKSHSAGCEHSHGRFYTREISEGLADLRAEIESSKPRMIIAVGGSALWALTSQIGISSWRGSMLWTGQGPATDHRIRVVPVYHPDAILRDWSLRSVTIHDLRRAAKWANEPDWPVPAYDFQSSPDAEQVLTFIAELRAAKRPFACDIETTGRQISLIALANSTERAICIPLMTRATPDGCYFSEADEHRIVDALRGLMTDPDCGVIGQYFHYDAQYFVRHLGIWPHVVDDTMWMQHVCFPGTPKSLDYLASLYCRWYVYWKDELKDYRRLPDDEQKFRLYNCQDVVYTYECWQALRGIVDRMRLTEQYAFQLSLFDPVLDMMVKGIRVDMSKRSALRERITTRMAELETNLEAVVGTHVGSDPRKTAKWYRSPKQVQRLFYEECSIKPIIDRKTQRPTTNDEALEKIGNAHPALWPVCQWLKEHASLDTFVGTFLEARVDADERMRCSYNVGGTETYRFSSSQNAFGSGLNLQNIPRSDQLNVRGMFVPDPGHAILDFDLSSADLRVVIAESGAKKLQAILDAGLDVYGTLAAKMDGSEYQGKKHPKRQVMKNVAHALDYVGGGRTISSTYGLPLHQVEATKSWYFRENPEIPSWHRRIERDLRATRRVRNAFGYTRTYFDRVEQMLSAATAWVGQSTVAITINKGLLNIWRRLPWCQLLLQVHDSVVVQIPLDKFTPEGVREIQECLLIPIHYSHRAVPLVIPVECKASVTAWGEAKSYPLPALCQDESGISLTGSGHIWSTPSSLSLPISSTFGPE